MSHPNKVWSRLSLLFYKRQFITSAFRLTYCFTLEVNECHKKFDCRSRKTNLLCDNWYRANSFLSLNMRLFKNNFSFNIHLVNTSPKPCKRAPEKRKRKAIELWENRKLILWRGGLEEKQGYLHFRIMNLTRNS